MLSSGLLECIGMPYCLVGPTRYIDAACKLIKGERLHSASSEVSS